MKWQCIDMFEYCLHHCLTCLNYVRSSVTLGSYVPGPKPTFSGVSHIYSSANFFCVWVFLCAPASLLLYLSLLRSTRFDQEPIASLVKFSCPSFWWNLRHFPLAFSHGVLQEANGLRLPTCHDIMHKVTQPIQIVVLLVIVRRCNGAV